MIDVVKDGVLGIDPGDRRIGLAVAHGGLMAAGLGVIEYAGKRRFLERLKPIMAEENIGLVVVGLPYNMDGSEGTSAKKARRLGEEIERTFGIPVEFEDERLSTEQALKHLKETGRKAGKNKGKIDMMAAVNILQSYLDERRG